MGVCVFVGNKTKERKETKRKKGRIRVCGGVKYRNKELERTYGVWLCDVVSISISISIDIINNK